MGVADKPVCSKDGDSMEVSLSVGTNITRKHVANFKIVKQEEK